MKCPTIVGDARRGTLISTARTTSSSAPLSVASCISMCMAGEFNYSCLAFCRATPQPNLAAIVETGATAPDTLTESWGGQVRRRPGCDGAPWRRVRSGATSIAACASRRRSYICQRS